MSNVRNLTQVRNITRTKNKYAVSSMDTLNVTSAYDVTWWRLQFPCSLLAFMHFATLGMLAMKFSTVWFYLIKAAFQQCSTNWQYFFLFGTRLQARNNRRINYTHFERSMEPLVPVLWCSTDSSLMFSKIGLLSLIRTVQLHNCFWGETVFEAFSSTTVY